MWHVKVGRPLGRTAKNPFPLRFYQLDVSCHLPYPPPHPPTTPLKEYDVFYAKSTNKKQLWVWKVVDGKFKWDPVLPDNGDYSITTPQGLYVLKISPNLQWIKRDSVMRSKWKGRNDEISSGLVSTGVTL